MSSELSHSKTLHSETTLKLHSLTIRTLPNVLSLLETLRWETTTRERVHSLTVRTLQSVPSRSEIPHLETTTRGMLSPILESERKPPVTRHLETTMSAPLSRRWKSGLRRSRTQRLGTTTSRMPSRLLKSERSLHRMREFHLLKTFFLTLGLQQKPLTISTI